METNQTREPWNKGKLVGQKPPLMLVHQWVAAAGFDPTIYGTHTMRRTKAKLIYKRTKNLRKRPLVTV
jgi:hypothetical protein